MPIYLYLHIRCQAFEDWKSWCVRFGWHFGGKPGPKSHRVLGNRDTSGVRKRVRRQSRHGEADREAGGRAKGNVQSAGSGSAPVHRRNTIKI